MAANSYVLSSTTSESLTDWIAQLREFELDNMFETRILGRGYEYTKGIRIVETTNNKVTAKSIDSSEYDLFVQFNDRSIFGSCSCPYEGACKHLAALLVYSINK